MSMAAIKVVMQTVTAPNGEVISAAQQSVLFVLAWHLNCDTGRCYPSAETIARATHQHEDHVRRLIKSLVDNRCISCHPRGRNPRNPAHNLSNEYELLIAMPPKPRIRVKGECHPDSESGSPPQCHPDSEADFTPTQSLANPILNPNLRVGGDSLRESKKKKPMKKEDVHLARHIKNFIQKVARDKIGAALPWNTRDEKVLAEMIAGNPWWTPATWDVMLKNWEASDDALVKFGERAFMLLPRISRFLAGPVLRLAAREESADGEAISPHGTYQVIAENRQMREEFQKSREQADEGKTGRVSRERKHHEPGTRKGN